MMMAELIQGQASVAQPGTKDDFADAMRRVRQVTCASANTSATGFFFSQPTNSVLLHAEQAGTSVGATPEFTINSPHATRELASQH